jgi:hypothetical protein
VNVLIAQVDANGVAKLADYGIIGVLFLATLWTLKIVSFRYSEVLVAGRVEARGDLTEERKSRQAHEQQMSTLLGELVKQATEQKEALEQTMQVNQKMMQSLEGILAELQRLKGTK